MKRFKPLCGLLAAAAFAFLAASPSFSAQEAPTVSNLVIFARFADDGRDVFNLNYETVGGWKDVYKRQGLYTEMINLW